jgi:hypothetical protein
MPISIKRTGTGSSPLLHKEKEMTQEQRKDLQKTLQEDEDRLEEEMDFAVDLWMEKEREMDFIDFLYGSPFNPDIPEDFDWID